METVASPVEPELQLLTTWGEPDDASRRRTALLGTVAFHIAAIVTLFLLPESFFENKQLPEPIRHITPIFEPLTRLTQKAPNTAKAAKEFSPADHGGRPRSVALPAPAPMRASVPPPAPQPRKAVIPQPPPPKPVQNAQPVPEPPKVDATLTTPKIETPQLGTIAPPQIQPREQPKLPLQNLANAAPARITAGAA